MAAIALATSLLAAGPAQAESGAAPPTPTPNPSGNVQVTVPVMPYGGTADVFIVGPLVSRLHVLANDAGTPDPASVRLVGSGGAAVTRLDVAGLGTLTVGTQGSLVLTPSKSPAEKVATFAYRARSNGPEVDTKVTVRRYSQVLSAVDDKAVVRGELPAEVVVDIIGNDTMLVAGATRPCDTLLSPLEVTLPTFTVDVLPEPTQPPDDDAECTDDEPGGTTPDGTWSMRDGKVVFVPAAGFEGSASVFYYEFTDRPVSIAHAKVTVSYRKGSDGVGNGTGNGTVDGSGDGDSDGNGNGNGNGDGNGNGNGNGNGQGSGPGSTPPPRPARPDNAAEPELPDRWFSGAFAASRWFLIWPTIPAGIVALLHGTLVARRKATPTPS